MLLVLFWPIFSDIVPITEASQKYNYVLEKTIVSVVPLQSLFPNWFFIIEV